MLDRLREAVLEANLEIVRRGLVLYTFGNVSGIDRASGHVVIKPSGVDYARLTPGEMVVTDLDGRNNQAVQSASAYVPPIGQQANEQQQQQGHPHQRDRAFTASGGTPWDNKERLLVGRASNPSLQQLYQQGNMGESVPKVPSIPQQFLNQGQAPRLGSTGNVASQSQPQGAQGQGAQSGGIDNFLGSPIDVPTLIATKGYNPVDFDTRPAFVSTHVVPISFIDTESYLRRDTSLSNLIPRMTFTSH